MELARTGVAALSRHAKRLWALTVAGLATPLLRTCAQWVFAAMIAGVLIPIIFIHGTALNRGVLPYLEVILVLSGFVAGLGWLAARYRSHHRPIGTPGWPGGGPPRLLIPPRIGVVGGPLPQPALDAEWVNPNFPVNLEMVWGLPESSQASPCRIVFPRIRITNGAERPVNLSFRVLHRFNEPTVAGGIDWMPMTREEQPMGLPDSVDVPAASTRSYLNQGFQWPIDDQAKLTDGRVGPDGCAIEAHEYLSNQKILFTERYPSGEPTSR